MFLSCELQHTKEAVSLFTGQMSRLSYSLGLIVGEK